ncbi:MAG TPA: hypothetical protein VH298_14785 [Jatrophihabitans sp.]|nr:hypothetical protein [Jatrophihabitans sp.]
MIGGSWTGAAVESSSPRPGSATAAAVSSPCSSSAMCTAQSDRASANSRVPSSGSTIHNRPASEEPADRAASSDLTWSAGRSWAST